MTGRQLRKLRKIHGLSVESAAKLVHVGHRTWVRWEAEPKVPATGAHLFCLLVGEPWPEKRKAVRA